MIKLKNILTEITDWNFEMPTNLKDTGKALKALKALKMKFSSQDAKNSYNHLKNFEGGKMFKHMAYYIVQGSGYPPDVYLIHETQNWLRDEKVGVSQLTISKYDDYQNDQDKRNSVGTVLVQTDKFLSQLRKLNVIKQG